MTRNCVDKVEAATASSSAAILNNAVNPWASLERSGRPRRPHRLPCWTPEDLNDDRQQREDGRNGSARSFDDEVPADRGSGYQQATMPSSSASVRAVVDVEVFVSESSTEGSPVGRCVSPLLADSSVFRQNDVARTSPVASTLSWETGPVPSAGVGSALTAKASSEGDVLSGVEAAAETAAAAANRRSGRLLNGASALFGRFLSPTRHRLTTVSGAEWRHRRDVAASKRYPYTSSRSFCDAEAQSKDDAGVSRQSGGTRTVAATPTDEQESAGGMPVTRSCEVQLSSTSRSGSSRRSEHRVDNSPTAIAAAGDGDATTAANDAAAAITEEDAAGRNHEELRRTPSSRKTIRRFPSVERLDQPRRQSAAAASVTSAADSADRKRAERFRRQYIDVKLQRRAEQRPLERLTPTTKWTIGAGSMPTGVDVCGATRHGVIASPQLLQVPATANVTFHK